MMKKVCFILVFAIVTAFSGISAFAAPEQPADKINDEVYDKTTIPSEKQFLVKITRPEGNEMFFASKYYKISGQTSNQNIRVMILMLNGQGKYEPYKDSNGEASWIIGEFGMFIKDVELKKGGNDIRIVAFKDMERSSLQKDVNLQMNDFIITYVDESEKEKILNGDARVTDMLKGIFDSKDKDKKRQ